MEGKTMKLSELDDGLPEGYACRIIVNGKPGRTIYKEAGWMWRERSQNQHYVSTDGEYEHRRYLPAETTVQLIAVQDGR